MFKYKRFLVAAVLAVSLIFFTFNPTTAMAQAAVVATTDVCNGSVRQFPFPETQAAGVRQFWAGADPSQASKPDIAPDRELAIVYPNVTQGASHTATKREIEEFITNLGWCTAAVAAGSQWAIYEVPKGTIGVDYDQEYQNNVLYANRFAFAVFGPSVTWVNSGRSLGVSGRLYFPGKREGRTNVATFLGGTVGKASYELGSEAVAVERTNLHTGSIVGLAWLPVRTSNATVIISGFGSWDDYRDSEQGYTVLRRTVGGGGGVQFIGGGTDWPVLPFVNLEVGAGRGYIPDTDPATDDGLPLEGARKRVNLQVGLTW